MRVQHAATRSGSPNPSGPSRPAGRGTPGTKIDPVDAGDTSASTPTGASPTELDDTAAAVRLGATRLTAWPPDPTGGELA